MNNMSLARIMYGTSDGFHGPRRVKRTRASVVAIPLPVNHLPVWELPTLPEFLHKIWRSLTR